MDGFDEFNQKETLDQQNTNNPEEDLFGSEYTDNTTVAQSTNIFSTQQQDFSWDLDNDLNNTTTPQTNIFDDNTLDNLNSTPPPPTTTTFDDDIFTNQYDSYPTSNLPPTADELLYNDSPGLSSENNSPFNVFTNPVSSSIKTNELNSTEYISPLQAFNNQRQQEIAEMEILEKQKN